MAAKLVKTAHEKHSNELLSVDEVTAGFLLWMRLATVIDLFWKYVALYADYQKYLISYLAFLEVLYSSLRRLTIWGVISRTVSL